MRKLFVTGFALAMASTAYAAPNVTNVTQKGSLLVFSDIRVDDNIGNLVGAPAPVNGVPFSTLIRIQNDGSSDVDLKCFWMDGHKNRVDFIIPVTRNQPVWFDARTGNGSLQVNPFPQGAANGFTSGNRHPFLEYGGTPVVAANGGNNGFGRYNRGLLACWAIDGGAMNQVKWNHLSGTATVYHQAQAYEYNAYAFYVPTGTDLQPIGVAGNLNLNGLEYDACPLYQIGQFSPAEHTGVGYAATFAAPAVPTGAFPVNYNRLAVAGCNLNLNQDWTPVWTKLQFDLWNEEEVKFTGAFECADSWHETDFRAGFTPQDDGTQPVVPGFVDGIDAAGQNFSFQTLSTYAARYRVQGVASTQCNRAKGSNSTVAAVTTQPVGIVAVQSTQLGTRLVGTTLAAAGKMNGKIVWDVEGAVPEGGIR